MSVDRDIRARVAAGALPGPIRRVQLHAARARAGRARAPRLPRDHGRPHDKRIHELLIGHPFVVGASLRDGRYAWCKDNRKPGEGSFGKNTQVPLPVACTG